MIDYNALRALQAVIEFQSFEVASQNLHISQPAVTQRIQNFESFIGQKLLIRKTPYRATTTAEKYLSLLRKVTILENQIQEKENQNPTVKLAINRDSLDFYFLEVLADKEIATSLTLQIIADDQKNTLGYLKNGQVDMCISSQVKPLPNHTSIKLGKMEYSLVCSKNFHKRYFSKGVNKESLTVAPMVVFDRNDDVQHTYLKKHYHLDTFPQINSMPSVLSFKQAILSGFGYGLLPIIDIREELKTNTLIQLNPAKNFRIALYLHQWEYQRKHAKLLSDKIIHSARILRK